MRCFYCLQSLREDDQHCPHCGTKVPYRAKDVRDLPPGTILQSHFFVGRSIGRGGFGVTYLAFDLKDQRACAIKEFFPTEYCQRINSKPLEIVSEEFREDIDKQREKFVLEANVLKRIRDEKISGVVQFIDLFHENNTAYIVMEFLQGDTLDGLIDKQPKKVLPWQMAVDIVLECLDTLERIHKMGILHRDISTSNIFILPNGDITFIDFGIARYEAEQVQRPLTRNYKKQYSPPEQVQGKNQDPTTDLYALAIVLFKLIVGGTPADGSTGPLPPASKMTQAQEIPEWLDVVLTKATQPEQANRYHTAQAFAKDLRTHLEKTTPNQKASKQRPLIIAGIAIVVTVAGIGFFLSNQNEVAPPTTQGIFNVTAAITPASTPTEEPSYRFGDSSDKVRLMQAALAQMQYLTPEQCQGKLDFTTMKALAKFALDYDCAFDANVVTESFLEIVNHVAQNDRHMAADEREKFPLLSSVQREQLVALTMEDDATPSPEEVTAMTNAASLANITAETVPEIVHGRLKKEEKTIIIGSASGEEIIDIQLNGSYLTSILPNPTGEWMVQLETEQALVLGKNTIQLSYMRSPQDSVTIHFILDAECEPVQWANIWDDAQKQMTGQAEPGTKMIVTVNGETQSVDADEAGSFTINIPLLPQGSQVHVQAMDVVGNTWEETIQVQRAARQKIEILSLPEHDGYIAGDSLPRKFYGLAHAGDKLYISINGVRTELATDDEGQWQTELNASQLKENQTNVISVAYADTRDVAMGARLEAVFDPRCEQLVLHDSLYPSSKQLKGTTEAKADITLEHKGTQYETVADEEGMFTLSFAPMPYQTEVTVKATDAAGNKSEVQLRVKESLPTVLGKIIRPVQEEHLSSDRVAVSAWILAAEDVEAVLKLLAPNGREYELELVGDEVEVYGDSEFIEQQRAHKDEVAAETGFTIKKRISVSRYGTATAGNKYKLALYARQNDTDRLLAECEFSIETKEEEEDDELVMLQAGEAGNETDSLIVAQSERGYVLGLDEMGSTQVRSEELIFTGFCYAPAGTVVSIDLAVDEVLYSSADLRSVFGGTVKLTRAFRKVQQDIAAAISDIDSRNTGIIISVKLPRLEPGEHIITPHIIISMPDGSLFRHALRSYTLLFSGTAPQARAVKDISDEWAQSDNNN